MKEQSKLIIEGGRSLEGEVRISGAKNSAGHLLAAAILSNEKSLVHNVPDIGDTEITIDILRECGVDIERVGRNSYQVDGGSAKNYRVDYFRAEESRAPVIFLGALLAKFGRVEISLPGGDRIGARPLDRHMQAFGELGYLAFFDGQRYKVEAQKIHPAHIVFERSTHMGTDNALLASCLIPGTTIIENAAQEPEVDDMIGFLNNMGANIVRVSQKRILVKGVEKLHGTEYSAIPDRNEAVTYAVAALITRGRLFLRGANEGHMRSFQRVVAEMGGEYRWSEEGIWVGYGKKLRPVGVTTGSHPKFMTDWQPQITTLFTQADGVSVVIEKVHSDRFGYLAALSKMGAKFELFNPKVKRPREYYEFDVAEVDASFHGCRVFGPAMLRGTEVTAYDIRAGAALILAGLCAKGRSSISGVRHIERGYEDLAEKLRNVGATVDYD